MVHCLADIMSVGAWTSWDPEFVRGELAVDVNKKTMQLFGGCVKLLVDQLRTKTRINQLKPRPGLKGGRVNFINVLRALVTIYIFLPYICSLILSKEVTKGTWVF